MHSLGWRMSCVAERRDTEKQKPRMVDGRGDDGSGGGSGKHGR